MSNPALDLSQLASDVTTILDRRAHKAQSAQREAERLATIQAQREAEQAAETIRARRRADEALLAGLQTKITAAHDHVQELVEQYRALPQRITTAERDLSVLLQQAQQLRLQLELRN